MGFKEPLSQTCSINHQGGGYIRVAIFRLRNHSVFAHHILLTRQNSLLSNCSNSESIVEYNYFRTIFCTIFCTLFLYHIFVPHFCTIFSVIAIFVPYFPPRVGWSFLRHLDSPGELTLVTCLTCWWLYPISFYDMLKRSLDLNGIFILQEITSVFLIFLSYLPPTALISTVGVETILSRFLLQSTG